ncbi:MAG: CBS domain-containing protein [Nitrospirales bacterium]|nr:MAG: CBS domain-containing protein [Nitrospirales bacterium]
MFVKDIMTPVAEVLRGYEYLDQAVLSMKRLGLSRLPVVDHNRIVGILTDRDIDLESTGMGWDLSKTQVRNAMMAGDMTCSECLTVYEMTRLLKRMHKKCLVVLNNEGHAVGIVSEENISGRLV